MHVRYSCFFIIDFTICGILGLIPLHIVRKTWSANFSIWTGYEKIQEPASIFQYLVHIRVYTDQEKPSHSSSIYELYCFKATGNHHVR